ncbi:glutamine synthetase family protein [Allonocardiopsis opalescens]|uniref:Glutamine synthetase n=1 Tax=Allonocardiopsis opalescens TaxID=1144618 RepID=A0A2T0QF47_9ACTN|nr:glutamine synthetase family protein [Allonocardiopsis opalescens]PRY02538.1 glutamine synthetase [Allonocardiopsis opalescens]
MTASAGSGASLADEAEGRLAAQGVRIVALSWVDNAGISRAKAVPLHRLPHVARWGVGMSPVFDTFLVNDSRAHADGFSGPTGDLRLLPDLSRLTRLAAQPGWAWAPADRYSQDGTPYLGCHRWFAARMAHETAGRGLGLRMGFETEWTVEADSHPVPGFESVPRSGRIRAGSAYGLARLADAGPYLVDVADALIAQELDVLQIHPEYETGQFEVSTGAEDPLGAADSAVLVRHTLRAVSRSHGLRPSFAPLTTQSGAGNGGHLHLSIWRNGRNLLQGGQGPRGMTAEGEAFLAGVLSALPALTAIGSPTPASYLRLVPSRWAGVYQCWGWENREAAVRFVTGMPGQEIEAANAEIKCFDGAANPYLVVGTVIAAGLAGVDASLRLPPEYSGDPAVADATELERLEVRRLPTSLTEAVRHLESSTLLRQALGEPLFRAVLAVRHGEDELFAGQTSAEIIEATRWRY